MHTLWTTFELERRRWVEELGYPTLLNVRRGHDPRLRAWAEAHLRQAKTCKLRKPLPDIS